MRKILILGGSEFQIPLVIQAKKMGLYVGVVDINSNANAFEFADETFMCSIKDHLKIYDIAREFHPDAITPGMCDVAVCSAAYVSEKMGIPGIGYQVAKASTDKVMMIDVFRKKNVAHPEYQNVSRENIENFKLELSYPIISKPVDMAGSRGIGLIKSEKDLRDVAKYSSNCSDTGDILLEEFMEGPEVSVEILVLDGKATVLQVTDKITSGAPRFMELGHTQPSRLPAEEIIKIKELACLAAEAIGLINSVAHAEIIVTNDGPKMVEIGARMGGDAIQQQLIEYSTSINLQKIVIDLALGNKVERPKLIENNASAIRFIPSQKGIIESIDNNLDKDNPYIKDVKVYCEKGMILSDASNNSDRLGYIITKADTAENAAKSCDEAIKKIKINIVPLEKIIDDNMCIEAATIDDYDDYYNIRCDETDIYWNGHNSPPNYDSLKTCFMERLANVDLSEPNTKKIYMIRKRSNKKQSNIGFIMLSNTGNGIEIGVTIIKEYQGKGYGTRTIKNAVELALKYDNRIFSRVRDDNTASRTIFLKNDFQETDSYVLNEYPKVGTIPFRKYIYNGGRLL